MPLHIVRQDITKIKCDAIVNAANNSLLGGGGVDGAIHRAAGAQLLEECKTLGGCATGDAKITKGYNLPAKFVIHTVGPIWQGGQNGERQMLESCYKKSLEIARAHGIESIAFPLISSGIYGYPKAEALSVAVKQISEFLFENEMTAYIVVFDKSAFRISERLVGDVEEYIDDHYVDRSEHAFDRMLNVSHSIKPTAYFHREKARYNKSSEGEDVDEEKDVKAEDEGRLDDEKKSADYRKSQGAVVRKRKSAPYDVMCSYSPKIPTLADMLSNMDDNFAVTLLKLIDIKGMTDVECYKKANVSKQTWHKIMNEKNYRPSKNTVISFAIALKLTLEETNSLLATVGFTLSNSSKFDVIIEYFILTRQYDIFLINETLFEFDQVCLGV